MEQMIFKTDSKLQSAVSKFLSEQGLAPIFSDSSNKYIVFPGLCDVHVHFREPGFLYKETIRTGSLAAAHGGFTAVCTMPNLNPVPDCLKSLKEEQLAINKDSVIRIFPYGAITADEEGQMISNMEELADEVCAFSDDGKGVQNRDIMRLAMIKAKSLGKIISAHCEDNFLRGNGYIHDGEYAKKHSHLGISSESEYKQIERDLILAEETGCAYHVCHVSAKESVELIRQAKSKGMDVTCETAPHYLVLTESDLKDDGRFKMNPPLRSESDKIALIEGICDGTIDIIATDHAPHSGEEKSKGLKDSLMGIVGLETAFPVLYTELVMRNIITLDKLIELMSENPKRRFGIDTENDFTVFDVSAPYKINSYDFKSKGKSTPFEGKSVYGKCLLTVAGGKIVWKENIIER